MRWWATTVAVGGWGTFQATTGAGVGSAAKGLTWMAWAPM
jgi:hypothetical protein